MSGQTIEVLNTDAEGRLILCDAMTYVERFKPAAVIDIATLTGACVIALGSRHADCIAQRRALAAELVQAAGKAPTIARGTCRWTRSTRSSSRATSRTWRTSPAAKAARSPRPASWRNSPKGYDWAHLDVAGTAWKAARRRAPRAARCRCSSSTLLRVEPGDESSMRRVDFYVLSEDTVPRAALRWHAGSPNRPTEERASMQTAAREAARLDDLLWTFKDGSFLPHEISRQAAARARDDAARRRRPHRLRRSIVVNS